MGRSRIVGKITEYFITFMVIISINFLIPRIMPGDPFTLLSSEDGQVIVSHSEEEIERYKAYYGLDKPLGVQYVNYLKNLFTGNLGYSIYYKESVVSVLGKRMLWTLGIVLTAIALSFLAGTILGCLSAWYRDGFLDKFLYSIMIALSEVPSYLVGIALLFVVGAQWRLFPLAGGMKSFANYGSFLEKVLDIMYHGFMPVLALSIVRVGETYFFARNSMTTVLSKDYILTAKAKGLTQLRIIFMHALKNALPPICTRLFLSLGAVFGGAILVENVFNYPGIGRLIREAVLLRDYVLIQGIFLFIALLVLSMNFLSDSIYRFIDPRVRSEKSL